MTRTERRPLDEAEHAFTVDLMREALLALVVDRKQPVILKRSAIDRVGGMVLSVGVNPATGDILLMTTPDGPDNAEMHPGAMYLARLVNDEGDEDAASSTPAEAHPATALAPHPEAP